MGRGKKPMVARRAPEGHLPGTAGSVVSTTPAASSRGPAVNTAARKQRKPQLYCSRCLWMTGGGDCHRHGGRPWSDERQDLARLASSERIDAVRLVRLAELAGDQDKALFPLRMGLLLAVELDRQGQAHLKAGDLLYHYEAPRLLELLQSGEDVADVRHFVLLPLEREALALWLAARVAVDEAAVPLGKRHRKSALAS